MFTTTTIKALMTNVSSPTNTSIKNQKNKVTIIGIGTVGAAIAFGLLVQKIVSDLVLIDQDEALIRGEILDLQNATMFLDNPRITSSTDFASSQDSRICIISVGTERVSMENKVGLIERNTEIFKYIIPKIVYYNPETILIIVTNPVDILTYVAWKLSKFSADRVIGTGTILESARFRYLLARKLGISSCGIHAFVIGEQGINCVPVWSGVCVSGVRLRDLNKKLGTEEDPEDWTEIHKELIASELEVEKYKNCETWAMATSISRIVKAILLDTKECFPLSTHIKACRHGLDKDVFLSLPCVLCSTGISQIVRQKLNENEKNMLQKSADILHDYQNSLNL